MTAQGETAPAPPKPETLTKANSAVPVTKKKPYEKPGFRMEKVFVTTALSCGKVNNGSGGCAGNPLQTASAS
jgi:hypothetical protein